MTLIELLVAASILSLALAPILDLLARNCRRTRFSGDRLYATMRARSVLERYRALGAARLVLLFPEDGTGSARVAKDAMVSLCATPATTDDADLMSARTREARFDVKVRFLSEPNGRSGQLVARVNWTSPNDAKISSLSASEWIAERSN